jgi:hypothetical protein
MQTTAQTYDLLDFLDEEATKDTTIRFICAIRKALHSQTELSNSLIEMSTKLESLYLSITVEERNAAFEAGRQRYLNKPPSNFPVQPSVERPLPQTLTPARPVAERLSTSDLEFYFRSFCASHTLEIGSTFQTSQFMKFVEEVHLGGGEKDWCEEDLASAPSQAETWARWKNAANAYLQKEKNNGTITFSAKSKLWVVL